MTERRKFSAKFKAMVAMEAIKEQQSIAELAKKYEVHPSRIYQWKQEAIKNMEKLFGSNNSQDDREKDEQIRKLREKVGSLTMERDFFEYACKRVGLVKKPKNL